MKAITIGIILALSASASAYGATFKGHPCKKDCSGHKAGYAWAKKNEITSSSSCGRKTGSSFKAGCRAAVREN